MNTLEDDEVLCWQKAQYKHDKRNHFDILSRHKVDRLKHYGLHFAKYAGRMARGEAASQKSEVQTAIDSILVSLSAANCVSQRLTGCKVLAYMDPFESFRAYTDAAGRYCDAVEKIDHAEFDGIRDMLCSANQAMFEIALTFCQSRNTTVEDALNARREFLKERAFFVED